MDKRDASLTSEAREIQSRAFAQGIHLNLKEYADYQESLDPYSYDVDVGKDITDEENAKIEEDFAAKSRELSEKYWSGEAGRKRAAYEIIVGPPGIKLIKKVL